MVDDVAGAGVVGAGVPVAVGIAGVAAITDGLPQVQVPGPLVGTAVATVIGDVDAFDSRMSHCEGVSDTRACPQGSCPDCCQGSDVVAC